MSTQSISTTHESTYVIAPAPNIAMRVGRKLPPYLFIAPAIVLVSIFLLYPTVRSSYLSFTDYKGIGPAKWVGFANYRALYHDPVLSRSITNTLYWVIGTLI